MAPSLDRRLTECQNLKGHPHADVYFRDRLFVVRYRIRVTDCSFPVPGRYAVALLMDGELAGQRIIEVSPGRSS